MSLSLPETEKCADLIMPSSWSHVCTIFHEDREGNCKDYKLQKQTKVAWEKNGSEYFAMKITPNRRQRESMKTNSRDAKESFDV